MNFDINTLSTLLQMMKGTIPNQASAQASTQGYSQSGSQEYNQSGNQGYPQSFARPYSPPPRRVETSDFIKQNGIGEKVDFGVKPSGQPSGGNANPMMGLLDMMTGGKTDGMSSLMPMLMNMIGRPKNTSAGGQEYAKQQAAGNHKDSAAGSASAASATFDDANRQSPPHEQHKNNDFRPGAENAQYAQDESRNQKQKKPLNSRDRYSPITFAGYTLISALNQLYNAKRTV